MGKLFINKVRYQSKAKDWRYQIRKEDCPRNKGWASEDTDRGGIGRGT